MDLAGGRLGKVAEYHPRGAFEMGHGFAAVGDDVVLACVLAGPQFDEGARRLAPLFVRRGDHRDGGNRRMPVDDAFDLDRRDVLAAGNDDVFGSVLQLDIAVGVPDS